MRLRGTAREQESVYFPELVRAQSVQRLATLLATLHLPSNTGHADAFDFECGAMQQLLADVESVREEYMATPEDMQAALQANEAQLKG